MRSDTEPIIVIGGGLAGSEAAWQLARRGVRVRLVEMRPGRTTPAHRTPLLAELVCSNSLKAMGLGQASGLLQEELDRLGSVVLAAAKEHRVAAGQALAVDRDRFARAVTERLEADPRIEIVREEATRVPRDRHVIVATGPLTSDALARDLAELTGAESLYFYDAMAPIVEGDSIDRSVAFAASRYGKGGDDYLNCPMTREEFERFYQALVSAETVPTREFEEERVFQACQPIETLAAKGPKTLLFGPMKPVGLVDPRTGQRPHAVVQLRREDEAGERWNLVGFQTKLTYPEQERVFRLIPGLERARFHRLGSLHRNTYVDGPRLLDRYLRLRRYPWIQLAGQITGVEGYLESTAAGLWAGLNLALRLAGRTPDPLPPETAVGALVEHVVASPSKRFEPMNMNFGLLPPLGVRMRDKRKVKEAKTRRALEALDAWLAAWAGEGAP
ncbi:methylenetetrahydrofolate--tRNA-(uracil(54)-C(5))-methyltransferase (FADH(2)-oxidizing) TrmFO [Deferrisoma camini]|uniref:methylenetetrahydrofolate--tRNA-(uracil(54)- C(5))-methyltransferase (FADH(2)-oxidizing) TrmFO n=1 Tax=Deferrisoma camini TaxID=1035120 RepID=UPI00046D73BB|nr:methylenetetrahydrofolate--tRNA-(uracil(54)-C(5))-methyltransferase (FADH(2)-oxidizing) TrmFO [Deferrisoma camini]